ncbi:Uncharacterized protein RNJ44_01485 [Nakaseomyces bracarensis]|uniref:protein-serine/threonine phosphatase n=1 Tax=Nakaseomyces bracarensis TaxID=273131 RepID=A0ABR4NPV0_9SACH
MGQLLSHPLTEKTIEYNDYKHTKPLGSVPRFYNCVGSMQGYRLSQEDAHKIQNEDSILKVNFFNPFTGKHEKMFISMFAVFDGHGGDSCSKFLSGTSNPQLRAGLSKWIVYSFENHRYGAKMKNGDGRHNSGSTVDKDHPDIEDVNNKKDIYWKNYHTLEGLISQIIKDAFMKQDQELHQHFANSACGSTAVVALIINGSMLYVANSGDSRCILSSKSKGIKTMSFDHKPQHIGELIRINDSGGTVSLGRVGGVLALSRAFSDFQFKRGVIYKSGNAVRVAALNANTQGIPPQEAQVTVEPDVLMHKIDYSKDEFLVLACDGIWDIYNNTRLVQFIKYHLLLGMKLDGILTKLLDHGIAQANSSTGVGFDNMTAIVVVLNRPDESLSDWMTKMKLRLEREKGLA